MHWGALGEHDEGFVRKRAGTGGSTRTSFDMTGRAYRKFVEFTAPYPTLSRAMTLRGPAYNTLNC
jgi:hypothetical protein